MAAARLRWCDDKQPPFVSSIQEKKEEQTETINDHDRLGDDDDGNGDGRDGDF